MAQRPQGQCEQCPFVVITRDAVEAYHSAALAAVDEQPLSIGPQRDTDGLHRLMAVGGPITGHDVEVQAPEAIGAVVAVARAGSVGRKRPAAMTADDGGVLGCAARGRFV